MLVYDSNGKLVELPGDNWNSGYLPQGFYATPYQLAQATGVNTGAGGIENKIAAWDPMLGAWGNGMTYDTAQVAPNASGYSWDYMNPGNSIAMSQLPVAPAPLPAPSVGTAAGIQSGPSGTADPLARYKVSAMVDSPNFNVSSYATQRPDLVANYQNAMNPSWLSGNAYDPGVINYIKSFGSLNDYLTADFMGSNQGGTVAGPGGVVSPPSGPASPPPSTSTPTVLPGSVSGTPIFTPPPTGPVGPTSTPTTATPAPISGDLRNLQGEGANMLAAQVALAPQMLQQYQQFAPQYAATDLATLKQTLFGTNFSGGKFFADNPGAEAAFNSADRQGRTLEQFAHDWLEWTGKPVGDLYNYYDGGAIDLNQRLTEIANKQTVDSNTALRQGNVNDAANLGPQALAAMQALNPNLYGALGQAASFTSGLNPNAYAQQRPDLVNNWNNAVAYKANPNDPRWANDPNVANIAKYGSLNEYLMANAAQDPTAAGLTPGGIAMSQYQQQLGNSFTKGPQFQSVSATTNPLLAYGNQQAQSLGQTALGSDLSTMAKQQLALGGSLSDEQKRNATQAAREAFASRGLINSNSAVAQEILNRDAYSQQLLGQRQGFAQGVNQLEQAQQGVNNNYFTNLLGANFTQGAQNLEAGMANQGAGLQAQQLNTSLGTTLAGLDYSRQQQNFGNIMSNAQLQSANSFNPFSTITSAGTSNQGSNPALYGTGATTASGGTSNQGVMNMFNPFNQYASDYYNTNVNAAASAAAAKANNKASLTGSIIGGVAQLGGAAIGAYGLIAL